MSGLLSVAQTLQASQDDLQQQLLHTQAALQAQEQQKMSDSAVAAEATQSLQAANAALQTKIDELQSQVEAKQKELAALAETLQDSEAKATDAATQLLTAQLKAASEERESLESQLHSAQEALQVRESHSKDLQSQLEAARVQQAEASSELEAKKQELEAQVAAVTEELRASEEKASQQNSGDEWAAKRRTDTPGIPGRFAATAAAHTSGLADTGATEDERQRRRGRGHTVLAGCQRGLADQDRRVAVAGGSKAEGAGGPGRDPSGLRSQSHGRSHAAPNCPTEGGKRGARVTGVPAPLCAGGSAGAREPLQGFAVSARSRTCATGRGQQ